MDLPFGRSAGIETRTVPLLQNVVDALDDRSEIEIFGFDPDTNNEPQARTILHMDGFSAAYAQTLGYDPATPNTSMTPASAATSAATPATACRCS